MSDEVMSDLAGMRIVTVTTTVRAGESEWSDIDTAASVEVEPGWPENVALAAAVGGLRASLKSMESKYEESLAKLATDPDEDDFADETTDQPEESPEDQEAP